MYVLWHGRPHRGLFILFLLINSAAATQSESYSSFFTFCMHVPLFVYIMYNTQMGNYRRCVYNAALCAFDIIYNISVYIIMYEYPLGVKSFHSLGEGASLWLAQALS